MSSVMSAYMNANNPVDPTISVAEGYAVRVKNTLRRAGVDLDNLDRYSDKELLGLYDIGPRALTLIRAWQDEARIRMLDHKQRTIPARRCPHCGEEI